MSKVTGRCLCGGVTFAFATDATIWQGHCHCETCRRATGTGVVSWFGVQKDAWSWTGDMPTSFQSSDWATRWFCPTCGTPMGYYSSKLPDEMHGLAATLDDPNWYEPTAHFFHKAALPWLHVKDDLPRFVDGGKTRDEDA